MSPNDRGSQERIDFAQTDMLEAVAILLSALLLDTIDDQTKAKLGPCLSILYDESRLLSGGRVSILGPLKLLRRQLRIVFGKDEPPAKKEASRLAIEALSTIRSLVAERGAMK